MAFKLPSFNKSSGPKLPSQNGIAGIKKKITRFIDKMPYHYWIIASGVVSLILAIGVYCAMDTEKEQPKVEAPVIEMVSVVVADTDINARVPLTDKMLKIVEMPKDSAPDGYYTDKTDVINLNTATQIMKGDAITSKKVLRNVREAGFTGTIPPDCRAISIGINDVTGVAGFAKAGDYVDIMLVTGDKNSGTINSNIVLQNVLLLGLNKAGWTNEKPKEEKKDDKGKDDKKEAGGGDIRATNEAMATATIAVTPPQAMQVAAAAQKGTLYLTLRPFKPRDKYVFDTAYTTMTGKAKAAASSAPAPKAAPAPAPRSAAPVQQAPAPAAKSSGSVEVYRGTSSTREGR